MRKPARSTKYQYSSSLVGTMQGYHLILPEKNVGNTEPSTSNIRDAFYISLFIFMHESPY